MIKTAAIMGILSTTGLTVLAQMGAQVPEDFETWPATAILGVIALSSLAIAFFSLKKVFDAVATLQKVTDGQTELNARLNQRPCLAKRD